MQKTKENRGITLIVLVITIIVLLILAGVSITMLTGNNGILNQSKLAKNNTKLAEEKETQDFEDLNSYINEKTIKDNYTDINGEKATIPEGFTVDEVENVISKGLVVHGPDKANGDNGSEFVWIPVSDINLMSQCSKVNNDDCNLEFENGILKCKTHNDNEEIVGKLYGNELYQNSINTVSNKTYIINGLIEPALVSQYDNNEIYNNKLFSSSSLKEDYKNMAISVAKYKGFYVGRYETSLSDATEKSPGTTEIPQSKQGMLPTSAGNSSTYMWYGLYKIQDKTYTGENNSVASSMIWGSQYDAIINWVNKENNQLSKTKLTNMSLGNNSSGYISTTGNDSYSDDKINNIRDLGGNLREWTLEAYGTYNRVLRGGCYYNKYSPIYRSSYIPNKSYTYDGSRMTLYIK